MRVALLTLVVALTCHSGPRVADAPLGHGDFRPGAATPSTCTPVGDATLSG